MSSILLIELHYVTDQNKTLLLRLNTFANICAKIGEINTGHFIMFSMITNNYNRKTKGPTSVELFTATGKLKKLLFVCLFFLKYN